MNVFDKNFKIGAFPINEDSLFIIAEAGVIHWGDIEKAKEMIKVAASCGADAIKFQSFKTDSLILEDIEMADYQRTALKSKKSQFQMLKELEINFCDTEELKKISENEGLIFLTTPFDTESLKEVSKLDLDAYKIASTDTTNIEFIKEIAKKKKPLLISTGMTYMTEINKMLEEVSTINNKIILLQCTSDYPLDDNEVNLNVLNSFKEEFNLLVGFSDHSIGFEASKIAVGMGAKVIEKHFTLDKSFPGPDHSTSLNPKELKEFISSLKNTKVLMGSKIKEPTKSELSTRKSLQKCIVAKKNINKNDFFSLKNLCSKRTGGEGISAFYLKDFINKKSKKNYQKNEIINE